MVIHAIFGRSITTKAADDSLGVERLKDEELVLQSMEVCKGGRGIHRFNSKEEAIIKVKGKGDGRKGARTKRGATQPVSNRRRHERTFEASQLDADYLYGE